MPWFEVRRAIRSLGDISRRASRALSQGRFRAPGPAEAPPMPNSIENPVNEVGEPADGPNVISYRDASRDLLLAGSLFVHLRCVPASEAVDADSIGNGAAATGVPSIAAPRVSPLVLTGAQPSRSAHRVLECRAVYSQDWGRSSREESKQRDTGGY